ncbi:MAG: hypothetical protein OXT67_04475 [Zetaproteobacteria bacterium]|nr:hypothetical protein [Zetaproteobacteria bacterium]
MRPIPTTLTLALAICFGLYLAPWTPAKQQPGPTSANTAATVAPHSVQSKSQIDIPIRAEHTAHLQSNRTSATPPPTVETSAAPHAANVAIHQLWQHTDHYHTPDIITLESRLQQLPAEEAAQVVLREFYRHADNLTQRSHAIFYAGKLRSAYLLPMWFDILERRTPTAHERNTPHFHTGTLQKARRPIYIEQLMALEALGDLAQAHAPARHKLRAIVMQRSTPAEQLLLLRQQAYRELTKSDSQIKLMALQLPAEDPLRQLLTTHLP